MTIQEKAQKYSDLFESKTRENGSSYVILKNDLNIYPDQELHDSVMKAHGDRFPNDWTYGTYADLMQKVTEYELETIEDLEDARNEIVDSYVDIYTYDLTKWLNDDINNVYYLTEALEQFEPKDGFQLLAMAQYQAIDEVMQEVINLLGK